ncbi:MAG: hypothetical protein BGO25_08225 [Acidobacteriales bacterium 59-55]|nr:MAG: hypothetical protein BGO25_08225 [Acidobacteriales bacterium 59-55]
MRKDFMSKLVIFLLGCVAFLIVVAGAYWWANVPPERPSDVSAKAVFLWAGHLGLPAPKHGTWIECWTDESAMTNRCRLTAMDGTRSYEGEFVPSEGESPVSQGDLRIKAEPTSDTTHWVRIEGMHGAPLVFLENGTVLIPKDAYAEGAAKLEHLKQLRTM